MKRRIFLQGMGIIATALPLILSNLHKQVLASSPDLTVVPLNKPHQAWRELISPEAYKVLFEEDTESPGSSILNHEDRDGTFICAACYLPLFDSKHKYDSATGWPSFTQPISGHIGTKRDFQLIILRTEYHCARCGGHQGHVFKDGPQPRGERWCNNGVALQFVLRTDHLPTLRS